MMYCDKGMEFETDYLSALEKIKTFQVENDQLSLLDDTGNVVLTFIKLLTYISAVNGKYTHNR